MLEQIDVHRISEPSFQEFFCFLPSQCVYQVCMPSFLEADRLERDVVALQYQKKTAAAGWMMRFVSRTVCMMYPDPLVNYIKLQWNIPIFH